MCSAPLFQLVMMPSSVLLTIASSADSMMAVSQYWANSLPSRSARCPSLVLLSVESPRGLLDIDTLIKRQRIHVTMGDVWGMSGLFQVRKHITTTWRRHNNRV